MSETYLQHYGVIGMKWGIRRTRRSDAKKKYKSSTDKAFKEYEKSINAIEKPYKRGQNLSKNDYDREMAAEKKYQDAVAKAKADYKKDKVNKSRDVEIANKLYSKQSKSANKRVAKMSNSDVLVESMLMGSYGALKFNEAKARGTSTGKAAVEGILFNYANNLTYGTMSIAKYLDNRIARKK